MQFEAGDNDGDSVSFSLVGDSQASFMFTLEAVPPRSAKLLVKNRIDYENIGSNIQLKLSMDDGKGNNVNDAFRFWSCSTYRPCFSVADCRTLNTRQGLA